MGFPDEETLRKMRELGQSMPPETDRLLAERARELASFDALSRNAREEARRAIEAMGGMALQEYHRQLAETMRGIANVIGPNIRQQMAEFVASIAPSINKSFQTEAARMALELSKTFSTLQNDIARDAVQNIRGLAGINDASIRLALETIRNLQPEIASPVFTNFVNDALRQPETLSKKRIKKLRKSHLSKKKISRLSKEQREKLNLALTILGILIAFYSAIQAGKPIQIDPNQLAQLSKPQPNITYVFQILTTPSKSIYYLVIRDCELKPKPSKQSNVIHRLSSGEKVKFLMRQHKWIYVRDEGANKEGWVMKKYLKIDTTKR